MDTVVDMANAIKIQAKDVNVFYGEKQALNNVSIDIERSVGNGIYWPVRLRQINLSALF
jgi:hypothetical protein